MKRALLLLPLLATLACAKQDSALLLTVQGAFLIPQSADTLDLDFYDGAKVILHASYTLTAQTPLPVSVSIVQSGGGHPHLKINATLLLSNQEVGLGTVTADFQSGATVPVSITLASPN